MPSSAVELTAALVAIDSVNPSLVPGGAGEPEIAAFVAGWARDAGLEAEVLEATPGPAERGRPRARHAAAGGRCCSAATSTRSASRACATRTRRAIEGDRLYGRGAYDMKAGVAAALVACREAARARAGRRRRRRRGRRRGAREPRRPGGAAARCAPTRRSSPSRPSSSSSSPTRGSCGPRSRSTGRAAHGSRPHLGVDAIVKAGPDPDRARRARRARSRERTHPLLGRGSVHASLIEGGEELSSYPARCTLALERRTLPGETAADVEAEIDALLDGCRAPTRARRRAPHAAGARAVRDRPGRARSSAPCCAAAVLGRSRVVGASYWADAAFIAAAGIPTVLFGPGGEGAHAAEEWVSIDYRTPCRRDAGRRGRAFCA